MKFPSLICAAALLLSLAACSEKEPVILRGATTLWVFADSVETETEAYRSMQETWTTLAKEQGWGLRFLRKDRPIREDSMAHVSALVLWKTDLSSLSVQAMSDIERFVQGGGGLVTVEARYENPWSWPWAEEVLAFFGEKKPSLVQPVADIQAAPEKPSAVDSTWNIQLLKGAMGQNWQEVFAKALGKGEFFPQRVSSPRAPEDNRFTIKVLDSVMVEPMEMAILPDGKVLYIERRGKMKLYVPEENRTRVLHDFDVCTSGNYEDGMLGLTIDPKFAENHYIYLYYSPGSDCSIQSQYLSRFTLIGDSINLMSEKVILEVDVQRQTCCHSGGSLTWDAQGNLYLSTGDNTSSKESDGYSPLDERPNRGPFDAQKGSSNTQDLRGKIIRIRPDQYGGYDIPDGNLFPKDGSEGRPEIYVMGARNPFRITVDHKTGYVYWGDVGPDVGQDGKYGPQSFDEWNQARTPGYYGWPYFVGDNFPYRYRNFDNDSLGDYFDPENPRNLSPNNTGAQSLPPARPAFIWYPKGPSKEFPQVGEGSNSAMAGPVYYQDLYPDSSSVRFPEYYEGKWFIYEWARSWIKVVSFDEQGDLARIEPFLPKWKISKPIDMEFGPDGAMYLLEYGQNYFADNPDARLVRIEFAAGNRKPKASLNADKIAGLAPLEVHFSAKGSFDYDQGDSLSYFWQFGDSLKAEGEEVVHTFTANGRYLVQLTVQDSSGAAVVKTQEILVGNAVPDLAIEWPGNRSFYFSNAPVAYRTTVKDPEDEAAGGIAAARLQVKSVYVPDMDLLSTMTVDEALAAGNFTYQRGKSLIDASDCSSCHALASKSIGPSYYDVADRYRNQFDMVGFLANKIIVGGNGNWGEKIMAGHPQLSLEQATEMVRYILSLEKGKEAGKIPASGSFALREHQAKPGGAYLIQARYTDSGSSDMPAQTATDLLFLRSPVLQAEHFEQMKGLSRTPVPNTDIEVVTGLFHGNWLAYKQLDLSGIGAIDIRLVPGQGGELSLRSGSPDGPVLGAATVSPSAAYEPRVLRIPVKAPDTPVDLYLVPGPGCTLTAVDWLTVIPERRR